jgi:hypothetical protein
MRKVVAIAAVLTAWAGLAAVPATADEQHGSCKAAGEFVSTIAQELNPLGQTFVKPAAQSGDQGVSDVVASAHASLCEQRP